MVLPPFGFSVGDFLAAICLLVKICETLNEGSDDVKEFQEFQVELDGFKNAIEQMQQSIFAGNAIS